MIDIYENYRIICQNVKSNLPRIVVAGVGNLNNSSRYAIATARPSC